MGTAAGKLFAELVKGYGTTHVFFVPTILMDMLPHLDAQGIRKILTHGEKAAAYMADGYARAAGRPGICMAQHIGSSNLASGLRDAFMASSPVIAITGGTNLPGRYRHTYQEVEDLSQFDAVTRANIEVPNLARLPDTMRQAFRAATVGSPGPVHMRFPGRLGDFGKETSAVPALTESRFASVPPFRPAPPSEDVEAAMAALRQAERPIIVAGGGVVASGANEELLALAEALRIPVATSLNGKGCITDTHPLAVGVVGTYSRECANRAVSEADLVLFVGTRAGGQTTANWSIPAAGTRVIQIDIAPEELGRNYPNTVSLQGDARTTLKLMLAAARPIPTERATAWTLRVATLVAEWREAAAPQLQSTAVPLRPERICADLSAALPSDAVVVSDTGHAGMWTAQFLSLAHRDQHYIRCAGSLGWALPAAIGVKCAVPDRPVICFSGDGGFYYHLQEIETAARHGINVVFVVNNNSSLNMEIPLVERSYAGVDDGRPDESWRFTPTVDFARIAEMFGCAGFRVTQPGELADVLPRALACDRPAVIDVISDDQALAPNAWTPAAR